MNPHHAKFPVRRRKEQEDGWPSPYSLMVLPMSSPRNKDRKQQQGEDGERGSLDGKSTWASWNTTIALIFHDFMCFICVKVVCVWVLQQMTGLELIWCYCSCYVLFQLFCQQILLRWLFEWLKTKHPPPMCTHQPTDPIKHPNQPITMCYCRINDIRWKDTKQKIGLHFILSWQLHCTDSR